MKRLILIAVIAAASFAAHGTDGVFEINQVKLDAAGGTYTITQPGSYRLTSNLAQRDTSTTVIQISVDNVTLDLNGFAITGGNSCSITAGTFSCTASGSGSGIRSLNQSVIVRNGRVAGIAGICVLVYGQLSRVEDLAVAGCGSDGINTFVGIALRNQVRLANGFGILSTVVSDSLAVENARSGIVGQVIRNSYAGSNIENGFYVSGVIGGSQAMDNVGDGIRLVFGGAAVGNSTYHNSGYGINGDSHSTASQNSIDLNVAGAMNGVVSAPAGSNLCNGTTC